ncbi:hypothetical protein J2S13_001930 [Oikeobacillus pervagus]|uniref:DUF1657 domain-containing protein n=1 Tax=Oikeobacillus pervagus TaxID=1325931 RepID=A0AAJ1T2B9_9BACI|nr:DUF1657 domain-containing protein [Oikeobacillus pervagus]MDQ0215512.1 hypothetical protein [Oikeobacillus pervagus]
MTVASNVKTTLASLKSAQANFSKLALNTIEEDAKRIFHESMMETSLIIQDLEKRLAELEREEPQYKGF